jgi:hypothetical protein
MDSVGKRNEKELTFELCEKITKDTLVVSSVRVEATLDDGIGEHSVFGWFRIELKGENRDMGVDRDVFESDLMVRSHVGPGVELVEERSFDAEQPRVPSSDL